MKKEIEKMVAYWQNRLNEDLFSAGRGQDSYEMSFLINDARVAARRVIISLWNEDAGVKVDNFRSPEGEIADAIEAIETALSKAQDGKSVPLKTVSALNTLSGDLKKIQKTLLNNDD